MNKDSSNNNIIPSTIQNRAVSSSLKERLNTSQSNTSKRESSQSRISSIISAITNYNNNNNQNSNDNEMQ